MIRQIPMIDAIRNLISVQNRIRLVAKNECFQRHLRESLSYFKSGSQDQSTSPVRLWLRQCECVLAQRLRRTQQMLSLYARLWTERKFKDFLRVLRQRMTKKGRELMLSAAGITTYNWQQNRITDHEMRDRMTDIDYAKLLKKHTLCEGCTKHDINCGRCPEKSEHFDGWTVFIEKEDLTVWRRPHASGGFEYKVYGAYNDVTAKDFLNVQIDTQYRKKWDTTAVVLEVIDTDRPSNSDIIYWEMLWPKLFTNRDYVFNRRFLVDHDSQTLMMISKSTDHPYCPKKKDKYRVTEYWSCMVIKPHRDVNTPGIEFSLTYFDNPGLNIPSTVTNWVAMRAMPDFLTRLRDASRKYKDYCRQEGIDCFYDIKNELGMDSDFINTDTFDVDDIVVDNTIYEAQYNIRTPGERKARDLHFIGNNMDNVQTNVQNDHHFQNYLHSPYYLN